MKYQVIAFSLAVVVASIQGCGKKEEAPTGTSTDNKNASAAEIICTLAPSQSPLITNISGAAGASSAAVLAIAPAMGLTVVTHSSGAFILSGTGGYVAGTLGGAIVAPVIVGVGLVVGGTAVTVELLCASRNHPNEVAKVEAAAAEFSRRSRELMTMTPKAVDDVKANAVSRAKQATVEVKRVAGDVFEYAYQARPSSFSH